jgi:hypothetical protein
VPWEFTNQDNAAEYPAAGNNDVCHPECLNGCKGGSGNHQCVGGCRHFNHESRCVAQCPTGSYASIDRSCLRCHRDCAACFGPGKRQCLVCRSKGQTPMFVDVVKGGICVAKCSTGLFVQNATTCIECPSHCDVCSDNVCMSCAKNFVLSTDKKCVPSCPDGHFSDIPTRSCVACHETCSTCVGPRPSQCGLCRDNLFYYERSCVDKCPSGFFADAGNLFKSFSFLSLSM